MSVAQFDPFERLTIDRVIHDLADNEIRREVAHHRVAGGELDGRAPVAPAASGIAMANTGAIRVSGGESGGRDIDTRCKRGDWVRGPDLADLINPRVSWCEPGDARISYFTHPPLHRCKRFAIWAR